MAIYKALWYLENMYLSIVLIVFILLSIPPPEKKNMLINQIK